nr:PDR/VanB family oxidoreductase [Acinetobacter sp. Marseille-Q1620]
MQLLKARVKSITYLAQDILGYEFEGANGQTLPAFTAGSHIDLHVENVPMRSYSLCNRYVDSKTYRIAICKDINSRGGSIGYLNNLKAGQIIEISAPRNNFEFHGKQNEIVFIAGGIGITPILSMIETAQNLNWKLYYFARSEDKCAFAEYLRKTYPENVEIIFSDCANKIPKRVDDVFNDHSKTAEFYCCGPGNMIEEFKKFHAEFPNTYYESFVAEHQVSTENSYTVELRKSNKFIEVVQGETLLDALLNNGCDVMNSCREGICGACETLVLEGEVDHRDSILTDDEKRQNKSMFPCCSSAKGKFLVLDL